MKELKLILLSWVVITLVLSSNAAYAVDETNIDNQRTLEFIPNVFTQLISPITEGSERTLEFMQSFSIQLVEAKAESIQKPISMQSVVSIELFNTNPDFDYDGISNELDEQPTIFSQLFTNGISSGTITSGQENLTITDVSGSGINIVATGPATVDACGISSMTFVAGDIEIICGSVTVQVISGSVSIEYFDTDNSFATTTLQKGDDVTFDDDTLTFANNDDTQTVVILVDGVEETIAPGETFTVDESPEKKSCKALNKENPAEAKGKALGKEKAKQNNECS